MRLRGRISCLLPSRKRCSRGSYCIVTCRSCIGMLNEYVCFFEVDHSSYMYSTLRGEYLVLFRIHRHSFWYTRANRHLLVFSPAFLFCCLPRHVRFPFNNLHSRITPTDGLEPEHHGVADGLQLLQLGGTQHVRRRHQRSIAA